MSLFQIEQVRKRDWPPPSGSGCKPPFLTALSRTLSHILAVGLSAVILLNTVPSARACGPSYTTPLFVFKESPDLPFQEFTNGKIGIVRPTFGRKTLFIAYRYLNGNSFNAEEQRDLVLALKGTAPEEDQADGVKAWIDVRKQFLKEDQPLPDIYVERQGGGAFQFFPNCTKNAFEVALQTLKDRSATYGAEDANVRAWLAAQDIVFQNCYAGAQIPNELGGGSPTWLQKDRDYQIAAAHFYSLNFDEARARFEKIATDNDSPWQPIAGYLVARTLIRQASLGDDKTKRELYERAERRLENLILSGGKYAGASKKLLALVKYQIHPEERVVELGRALVSGSTDNLRQDLIDYVWLLDKLESRILAAEEERKKKLQSAGEKKTPNEESSPDAFREGIEKYRRGDWIHLNIYPKKPDGTPDYTQALTLQIEHDASEEKIFVAFENILGRKLTDEETKEIKERHQSALSYRRWVLSPLRKWDHVGLSQHEGCDYDCTKLTLDLTPEFLRSDDLSDWILTTQTGDTGAYNHAFAKWRETGSPAWLVTALVKAEKSSPRLDRLLQAAERITRDEPAYPTVAYHLIRLKVAMGQTLEARKLLDEIMSSQLGAMPVSAQNLFLEQRTQLARGLNEFLRSAPRKPLAFYSDGMLGKFSQMLETDKGYWNPQFEETKEEYERELDERYKDLLPWDDRLAFEEKVVDVFDWHFPVQLLAEAARNPNVPDYLQRNLVLAAWTRAILLNNDEIAQRLAPEVPRLEPKMASVFQAYLKARTPKERHNAAVYVLLKFPDLSPFVDRDVASFTTSEELDYFFSDSWWCPPSDIELDFQGNERPKVVPKPNFLTAAQLEAARREHVALIAIGDAKSYLGKQAIEWARSAPRDPRIPEVLFIATQANQSYKYGCNGWDFDEKTKATAERILRQRYPQSPWIAKLADHESHPQ